jgi:hypothetical protein
MRTLLISLGGARYPSAEQFRHPAFGPSSRAIAKLLTHDESGIVGSDDHLDLFDDSRSWPDQLIEARNWLQSRTGNSAANAPSIDNIVIHYVGHGWFLPNTRDHHLTINHTDPVEKAATSARLGHLNDMLLREAKGLRRFYLIDACFAAASLRDLMAGADEEVIEQGVGAIIGAWPEAESGKRGVAALCSADKDSLANARGDREFTQFTDGILHVLERGDSRTTDRVSLRRLYDLLRTALRAKYQDNMVHPVLVAPSDRDGGIAGIPLFHNPHPEKPTHGFGKLAAAFSDIVGNVRDAVSNREVADDRCGTDEEVSATPVAESVSVPSFGLSTDAEISDRASRDIEDIRALEMALSEDVSFRQIVYRFFRLPQSEKAAIIGKLNLGRSEDASMTEIDRFKIVLSRARADGDFVRLQKLIGDAEATR